MIDPLKNKAPEEINQYQSELSNKLGCNVKIIVGKFMPVESDDNSYLHYVKEAIINNLAANVVYVDQDTNSDNEFENIGGGDFAFDPDTQRLVLQPTGAIVFIKKEIRSISKISVYFYNRIESSQMGVAFQLHDGETYIVNYTGSSFWIEKVENGTYKEPSQFPFDNEDKSLFKILEGVIQVWFHLDHIEFSLNNEQVKHRFNFGKTIQIKKVGVWTHQHEAEFRINPPDWVVK